MPTVIITDLSPGELFARSLTDARRASAEIDRLMFSPFDPGETREDRALKVAAQARVLSEAWTIIDGLANHASEEVAEGLEALCTCGECVARQAPQQDNANTN